MVADGRRTVAAVVLLVLAIIACESAPVGPSPVADQSLPTVAPSPATAPSPGTLPTPFPTPFPTAPTPAPSPTPPAIGSVELRFLDRDHVPGSRLRSAVGQLVWSGGPRTSTQIWRFVPGDAPQLVVDVRRRGSTISDVVASEAGYAFVEVNAAEYELGGWRIWFVRRPGAAPVELDRGLAYGAGFPPTLAMDGERIAWAAFDEPSSGDVSRLRVVSTDDIDDVTTLIETPVRDGLLWLPALNDDELWYAILHPDWDGSGNGDEYHVERLDLSAPSAAPLRFEGTANDFSPAVTDTHIAWKTQIGDGAALNWGTISVLDRRTSARWTVPIDDLDGPSLGTRFLTFEELTRSRLAVFDLVRGEAVDLLPNDLAGEVFVGGQSISGSLLAFFTQRGDGAPRIGWTTLPE